MKKGSFGKLLLCDFYMIKKSFLYAMLFFVATACFALLTALSREHGNLALLLRYVDGTAPVEVRQTITSTLDMAIRLFPALTALLVSLSTTDAMVKDDVPGWRHFKKTTPVGNFRFALVKTVRTILEITVAVVCASAYLVLIGAVTGSSVTKAELRILMLFLLFGELVNVLGTLAVTYFHSMDKGMLCSMAVVMIFVMGLGRTLVQQMPEGGGSIDRVYELVKDVIPYVPLFLVVLLLVLLGGLTILYSREES